MKKKLLLIPIILVFVLVLSLSLVACNSATTQGLLANILNEHSQETFTYEVYNSELDQVVGEYVVDLKAYANNSTIPTFGNKTDLKVNYGILVTGKLTIDSIEYNTGCYFDIISNSAYMIPKYTYREEKENGVNTYRLYGTYDGSTLSYEKFIGGDTTATTGAISTSSPFYDNNEFHQSLRTVTTLSTAFAFSFNVPLVTANEDAKVSLTASCNKKETIPSPYNTDGIECYRVNIARATQVASVNQTLYYASSDLKVSGWKVKNALIKIVEPFKKDNTQYTMEYTLKSLTIA